MSERDQRLTGAGDVTLITGSAVPEDICERCQVVLGDAASAYAHRRKCLERQGSANCDICRMADTNQASLPMTPARKW